jgi:uncharacterized protein
MQGDFAEHIAHAVTNGGLKLIINSTEQCNLRCKYCYESFVLKQMPAEIVRGILSLVEKRASAGLDWLEVEFFGGEPLAAWEVVKTLSDRLREICDGYGVKLLGGMTTNATLLDQSKLDTLARNHFTFFQITLDGPKDVHDKRRTTSSGKGTFDAIWRRLKMLKSYAGQLEIMIRLHFDAVTPAALMAPPSFLDELARTFIVGDRRFSLHFNPIEPWGKASAAEIPFFAKSWMMEEALSRLLDHAQKVGIPADQLPQATSSVQTGESGHLVCYAARANSFVIRSDGRIAKCTVAFESERNTVGRLLPDGSLQIDHERHLPWLRGLISGDPQSLRCPAMGLVWPQL